LCDPLLADESFDAWLLARRMIATILTFIAEIAPDRRQSLDAAVSALRRAADAPPHSPFGAISTLHFASVVVFDDDPARQLPALLVFESNIDGPIGPYVDTLVHAAAPHLHALFGCCRDYTVAAAADRAAIGDYLRRHVVQPNAWHVGSFSHTAGRIVREASLHDDVSARIDRRMLQGGWPTTAFLAQALIADEYRAAGTFGWVPAPDDEPTWWDRTGPTVRLVGTAAVVVLALPAIGFVIARWLGAVAGFALEIALVALYGAILRWHEGRDVPQPPSALDPALVKRLELLEDRRVQNHLASLTTVKPGLFRRLTIRVVLWAANLVARTSIHGTLAGIPSIHFAHWALVDNGRRLLFLSNFDGSWESYLDDFIDRASPGLTAIWTNTVGFPATRFLVGRGARDGVAFKAFARSQQVPTGVWYSAYPDLTVQQIDRNSRLRVGLASAPTRPAALIEWLRLW
jgi:hypothetical protein